MRAVPWSPDGSDTAFDIQVEMARPAEVVPRAPGEVLMENTVARTCLRRADFEHWGLSEGCPGCRHLRTGKGRQQAHSEARRRRIEGLLKGDLAGSARLAAADERVNRALADAVARYGGSSASGARPSATTSTDQGTDAARASSEEHIDGDVAMGGHSARQPSPTAGGGSRRRENHVKSELSNRAPLNSTFREDSSGRRLLKDIQLPSLRKRHWTGLVRTQCKR